MAIIRYNEMNGSFAGSETSLALDLMRWPLALCVVAEHWFMWELIVPALELDPATADLPILKSLIKFVEAFVSDNGVALFLFISGYLFFAGGEMTKSRYIAKLKKRFLTLFVPYVLWNVLYVVFLGVHYLPVFSSVFPRMQAEGFTMTLTDFFAGMFVTPAPHNANLWFIRELMTCVLLVPLIYRGICKSPMLLLGGFGLCYFFSAYQMWQYPTYLFDSLFFFSLGGWLSVQRCDLAATVRGKGLVSGLIFVLAGVAYWSCADYWAFGGVLIKFVSLLNIILFGLCVSLWCVGRGVRANAFLTGATFFVFASHPFLLSHFVMFLARLFRPESDIAICVLYLSGYFLLILLLLGVYKVMSKFAPGVTGVFVGRRNMTA